jgi:predicted dehydrogenase
MGSPTRIIQRPMNSIRLGIVGLGNIGRFHAGYVLEGKVARCELTAVCSRNPAALAEFVAKMETLRVGGNEGQAGSTVPLRQPAPPVVFESEQQLMRSGLVDAVLIATPHWQHPASGIAAFEAGLHVMTEKPVAAHKADAERFNAAHAQHPQCVFGVMSQFRAEPRYQKMREMIRSGALGSLVRVSWINTDWFRPEAYYASSEWRATWRGEGGGVLINQCLHNLDMLQWLVGMPSRVRGFCKFGRFHDIEVEDDVTAYFEWADGATGTFVSSTGEAPGTNRLEISGTRGRLVLENGKLFFTVNEMDAVEKCRSAEQPFAKLASTTEEIPFENAALPHAVLLQNFVNAILDGEKLLAPGVEGINAVELANAIVHSSLLEKTVTLPLDGAAWETKLNELIANSTVKKVVRAVAGDVASSFKR